MYETTISGPDNLRPHAFRVRPDNVGCYFFSRETTISGPEHDTYNLRPHAFHVRLQYQAPEYDTYNLRPHAFRNRNPRTFAKDAFFGQSLSGAH